MNYSSKKNNLDKYTPERLRVLLSKAYNELDKFDSALNSMTCAFFLVDTEGRVEFGNRFSYLIFNRPFVEGEYIWDMFQEKDISEQLRDAILASKQLNGETIDLILPNLNIAHLICRVYPRIYQKHIHGWVVMITDYTEQRQKQEMSRRNEYLQSITNITASIAHELKNPLGAMSIHLQLLRKSLSKIEGLNVDEPLRDSMQKSIKVIEEEIEGMNNIIGLFLNNMNINSSDVRTHNLNELISAVIDFVKPDLNDHKITYKLYFGEKLPFVLISRPSIMHVLLNIIKNAIDEMYNGGEIIFNTYAQNGRVYVSISDTGAGIENKFQKTVFNPYFTTKTQGTGIGLAISDKIMQLHHGSIRIDSTYSKGASFVLEFPQFADEQHLLEDQTNQKKANIYYEENINEL